MVEPYPKTMVEPWYCLCFGLSNCVYGADAKFVLKQQILTLEFGL